MRDSILRTDALSSVPRALTALIYQQRCLTAARQFTHDLFLSRNVDIRALIRFRDPKVALVETVAKFGRERPISRYSIFFFIKEHHSHQRQIIKRDGSSV